MPPTGRGSLKYRIAASFILWVVALKLGLILVIPLVRDHFAMVRIDQLVGSEAATIGRYLAEGSLTPADIVPATELRPRPGLGSGGRLLYRITREDGSVVVASSPLATMAAIPAHAGVPEASPGVVEPWFLTAQVSDLREPGAGPFRVRAAATMVRAPDGARYTLIVASSLRNFDWLRSLLTWTLIGALIPGALWAALAGWVVAGRITRRIEEVGAQVQSVTSTSLDGRVRLPASDDEIGRMAADVNAMLDRIGATVRGMERYMAEVSHELRTPVATLLAEAHVIKRSTSDADSAAFAGSVEDEMRRLSRLIDGFLTLARFEHGHAFVASGRTDVNDIALESVRHNGLFARQHGVAVSLNLYESGESGADTVVQGDAELLRIAVDNLLRNAVQFSARGAGRAKGGGGGGQDTGGTVDLRVEREDGHAVISVRDRGPGIPPEFLARIFDRFVQAPGPKRSPNRGLGLGLAIAKAIVNLHKGRIAAENRPASEGGGCLFTIRLPLAAPAPVLVAPV